MDWFLSRISPDVARILDKALAGKEVSAGEGARLFEVSGREVAVLAAAADELRERAVGNAVTFVHNRNINFTNYCAGRCLFCGFRRQPGDSDGFLLDVEEIVQKALEAGRSGATEVCIQGGLYPGIEPGFYTRVCEEIKRRLPGMHIHAFSPMEVLFASRRMGCTVEQFLGRLKASGLDSMPGTAAEILDDSVRKTICPGKLNTAQWVEVISTAHRLGIPTSATMMYGHVEKPWHRAAHISLIRDIQKRTGGFTEFVPLSFVHPNTELYRRGLCGPGTSGATELKAHAIARIMLYGHINNIQVSWVKLGKRLAQLCLGAGGNDLGGTLMEENISRMAGSNSPTAMSPGELKGMIRDIGRVPVERNTTYNTVGVSA